MFFPERFGHDLQRQREAGEPHADSDPKNDAGLGKEDSNFVLEYRCAVPA